MIRTAPTTTTPALAVGTRFQVTDVRPYTDNGVRGVHVITRLATVTEITDTTLSYVAEPVDEHGRPGFAPTLGEQRGTALLWAVDLYFARGEWQPLPAAVRPLVDVLAEHVAEVRYRRMVAAFGAGFHPDTRGADYSTLPAGYTATIVDNVIDDALAYNLDVYDIAIAIMPI